MTRRVRQRRWTMLVALVAASLWAPSITPSPAGSESFPGANGRIAFVSIRDASRDIYTVNSDGSDERRLTDDLQDDVQPSWSPDGTEIVFNRGADLFVMESDGSNQRMVVGLTNIEYAPTWSPDNTKIAFTRAYDRDETDIVVVDLATGIETRLTETPGRDEFPSWSPDGSTIAYIGAGETAPLLHAMDADGSNQRSLGVTAYYTPSWSPDGSRLAFTDVENNSGRDSQIFIVDRDGSNLTQLTRHEGSAREPSWSPDGREVVYGTLLRGDGNEGIYRIRIDGGAPTRVVEWPGSDVDPNWQAVQSVPPAPPPTTTPAVVPTVTPRITG